jgi:multidrug resistance efflux pump
VSLVKKYRKYVLTGAILAVALIWSFVKYWGYVVNPWTRNGQVRAQVIQITPRVSGPISDLPIRDNQALKAGDLLFEIDPRTFEVDVQQALADLDSTRDQIDALGKQVEAARADIHVAGATIKQAEAAVKVYSARVEQSGKEFERQKQLDREGATSKRLLETAEGNYLSYVSQKANAEAQLMQMQAGLREAEAKLAKAEADLGAQGEKNARLRQARAKLRQAELNLEFTKIRAPVDGYVTNLNLRLGSQAVQNKPALALVDANSFWVVGFFKENSIEDIRKGDRSVVTLMSYPGKPLEGVVDSLGWGISQEDGSTKNDLLPSVSPTFEWIRLAQRVPVRIHLLTVPAGVQLRIGTTASVLVMTGTSGAPKGTSAVAAPALLQ